MSLPMTIRTSVAQAAITKVGRLFNGTVTDVLGELLQNARRAGATMVAIETLDLAGHPTLCVRDDGRGIDDPALLVTLGQSGWDDDLMRREDPAGMGIFSLAGHRVEIRSWSPAARLGWRVVIAPDSWEASTDLTVEPFDHVRGTEILIDMPEAWENQVESAAARAARHFPLPVTFQGAIQPQADWLEGAIHIEEWHGSRIGILPDRGYNATSEPRINFHGVTVPCAMPHIVEVDGGRWSVRVDIGDTPELQLVLPARKEMVENEALAALRAAAREAIFRAIAVKGAHRLSHKGWCAARDVGVALPEADAWLHRWRARHADYHAGTAPERLSASDMVLMPDLLPPVAQSAALVLGDGEPLGAPLGEPVPAFEGYRWYDRLAQVIDVEFHVTKDGAIHRFGDALDRSALDSGPVDAITLCIAIRDGECRRTMALSAPLMVAYDDCCDYGVEEACIVIARDARITIDALVTLLDAACFSSSDDHDADSWDTQHNRFLLDAEEMAVRVLFDADEGILARCRMVLADRLQWLVPKGRTIRVDMKCDGVEVRFD